MPEEISAETEARFDEAVDIATEEVIANFEWMGLPDGDGQREALTVQLNDAIAAIMREWL